MAEQNRGFEFVEVMRQAAMTMTIGLACAVLAGCGLKGPLYLPEQASGIVTRPTQTPPEPAGAPNSPQTIDSPPGGATPAPEVTAPAPGETATDAAEAGGKEKKDSGKKEKDAAPSPR
jgi:predicted small lipoprotein YifL